MARVVFEEVCKRYGGVSAVENFSAVVEDGEFLVLVGPSGCGKSTTLRMVAGLEEISSGRLSIDGRDVTDVPPKDRDIAMVFQNYALYPHMTVYKNMAFGLKLRGLPRAEIDARVREAAETLDLSGLLERLPKQLSGGQRQRVAVGRAIVRKPKVFLFDEPLSNLDAKMRVEMRAEIRRLHRLLKATMIYVTHDQVEAMTMGDRIVVMNQGRIQQIAPPLEVYRRPANMFVAGFIGTPPMNMVRMSVKNGAFESKAMRFELPGCGIPDGEVMVGFRPETLAPASPDAGFSFTGRVDSSEPMGAETFATLSLADGSTVVARLPSDFPCRPDDAVTLSVDPARLSFFSPAGGERRGGRALCDH